jgi:hypothetical protein
LFHDTHSPDPRLSSIDLARRVLASLPPGQEAYRNAMATYWLHLTALVEGAEALLALPAGGYRPQTRAERLSWRALREQASALLHFARGQAEAVRAEMPLSVEAYIATIMGPEELGHYPDFDQHLAALEALVAQP